MSRIGITCLILFAGWTLACHAATLLHASLIQACLLMPVASVLLGLAGKAACRGSRANLSTPHTDTLSTHGAPALIGIVLLLIALHFSWLVFWAGSLVMLASAAHSARGITAAENDFIAPSSRTDKIWIVTLSITAALLTLWVSRSDLDDAYYVATAAFAATHPHAPLLGTDPMFGESGWPIFFPSYRFSAYEPLAGAIAHMLGVPAMDVMYKWLPPLGATAMTGAIFFCAREIVPKHWISSGTVVMLLMLLLGEEHRGTANFGFVRAFQGKALFLWIMIPLIYGLSFRYASRRGRSFDLFLLACTQLASIGLSNFAILCAPLSGVVAAMSAAPPFCRASIRRWLTLTATTFIALPYLAFVAIRSHDASVFGQVAFEPPSAVWVGIFGSQQQYLVAFLMLLAPFATNISTLRWRMAVPPLVLFAVLLNPLLAPWISRYITSPPVYWRVTWAFPVLIYLGVAVVLLVDRAWRSRRLASHATIAAMIALPLAVMTIPGYTLRPANHVKWQFASRKVESADSHVADMALALADVGRILADDPISGIIVMHENHPPLVNVRGMYLILLAQHMPRREYEDRALLAQFVSGGPVPGIATFKAMVDRLDVGIVVIRADTANYNTAQVALESAEFRPAWQSVSYVIWARPLTQQNRRPYPVGKHLR